MYTLGDMLYHLSGQTQRKMSDIPKKKKNSFHVDIVQQLTEKNKRI